PKTDRTDEDDDSCIVVPSHVELLAHKLAEDGVVLLFAFGERWLVQTQRLAPADDIPIRNGVLGGGGWGFFGRFFLPFYFDDSRRCTIWFDFFRLVRIFNDDAWDFEGGSSRHRSRNAWHLFSLPHIPSARCVLTLCQLSPCVFTDPFH